MPTPISNPNSYASGYELVVYYDRRTICQLASDTGTPIADPTNDPVITSLLARASGEVEAAAFAGGRYTLADLQALTGSGFNYLQGLVCDRVMGRLQLRRWRPDTGPMPGLWIETNEVLQQLRDGERIFGLQEQADAAQPELVNPDGSGLPAQPLVPFTTRYARALGCHQSRQNGYYGPWCDCRGW